MFKKSQIVLYLLLIINLGFSYCILHSIFLYDLKFIVYDLDYFFLYISTIHFLLLINFYYRRNVGFFLPVISSFFVVFIFCYYWYSNDSSYFNHYDFCFTYKTTLHERVLFINQWLEDYNVLLQSKGIAPLELEPISGLLLAARFETIPQLEFVLFNFGEHYIDTYFLEFNSFLIEKMG